jgi:DNA-binding GntR family transcriptional regulator
MPLSTIAGTTSPRRTRPRVPLPALPKPAPVRTLPEQIADSLRQAILHGRLRSGAHLVETSIAEQMQTSRGPVRDALLLLERDGLVAKLPNRGTRVLDFSERTLREAATLRAALEEFAVTLLVPRLTSDDISRLDTLVCRMEGAARRRAARDFNEADFHFHDAIFETCGHQTLHEVWRGMQRRIRAFLASSNWVSGNLEAVAQRHRAILRALASRKLSSARRALRAHFARLQKELALLLAGQSRDGGRGHATERSRAGPKSEIPKPPRRQESPRVSGVRTQRHA